MLLQGSPHTSISVGFVKWFGGLNKRTGRENEFGFIESITGEDLFVHASQLGGVVPEEGDFAVFTVDARNADRKRAVDVNICRDIETFDTEALIEYLYDIEGFQKFLVTTKYRNVLRSLANRKDNKWAVSFLEEILPISKEALYVVGELLDDYYVQNRILQTLSFEKLEALDSTFEFVPGRYFDDQNTQSLSWLEKKSPSAREHFFRQKIDDLSIRVRIHNQNMTTAASAHADRNTFGHLS